MKKYDSAHETPHRKLIYMTEQLKQNSVKTVSVNTIPVRLRIKSTSKMLFGRTLKVSRLNIFKSYGPDSVHPKVLKSLSDDFGFVNAVTKLSIVFFLGSLPKVWKTASVTALFKKGSKSDPLNYRPV